MATGSTFDFNLTRNQLIELAFKEASLLDVQKSIDPPRLAWGILRLGIILKRLEAEKKHIWAITSTPSTLDLAANVYSYTSANGLPTNIKRLIRVMYRNSPGTDTPVEIVRPEDFALIPDKFVRGTPDHCFLAEHRDTGSQTLYVWPALTTVNTADEVLGDVDGLNYTCIRGHTAIEASIPDSGADYLLYWEQTGSSASAVSSEGDTHVAAEHLRLWHERPLYDFVSASDNPDLPQEWLEVLLYELTQALMNVSGTDINEKDYIRRLKETSRDLIHPSQVPQTTNRHNKVKYY